MIKSTIYLDNNATTVIAPEVLDAMLPFFTKHYGNPSSGTHNFGLYAERIVEQQRKTLADIFHCQPNGIVFTSGATESINFVIKGLVEGLWPEKNKLITTTIEHPAVHESFKYLESKGVETVYIPVNREGFIDMNALALAMDDRTALVSVIAAHNEIGTLQECQLIAELCRERNIYSHFDFAQAGGKIPLNFIELQVDFVTLAAHKNHGPKGVGALLAHPEALKKIVPLFHGGNQENGFRSGTLNVPLIVGLVQCFALYETESVQNYSHMKKLWERLYNELIKPFPQVSLNGPVRKRLYSNFNFYVQNTGFQKFQEIMPHVAFSGSGACASHAGGSSTLRALGLPEHQVQNSVRFGLSRYTTEAEIAYVIETITSQILIR